MGWQDGVASLLGSAQAVFGSDVTYHPKGEADFAVRGIFRAQGEDLDVEAEVDIGDVRPMIDFHLAPAAPDGLAGREPVKGDKVTVSGTLYEVVEWALDGEGAVSCHLFEDSDAA